MANLYGVPEYGVNCLPRIKRDAHRLEMFWEYNTYLRGLSGLPPMPENERVSFFEDNYPGATWLPVWCGKPEVGFLVLGNPPHPDTDFYIQDAFVLPEYQNRGLMTKLVDSLPVGYYSLFILKRNEAAYRFWLGIFGKFFTLRDVLPRDDAYEQFGAFKNYVRGTPWAMETFYGEKELDEALRRVEKIQKKRKQKGRR